MKAIHPHFKYHNDNWVIQHLTIMHLFTMNKKYQQAGIDPDVEIEHEYFKCKTHAEAWREGHLTKRRRLGVINTPKVYTSILSSLGLLTANHGLFPPCR